MKKLTYLSLLIIGVIILAGCNQPGTLQSSVTPSAEQSTEIVTPAPSVFPTDVNGDVSKLKGVQIFFMHPWTGDTATLVDALVSQFNQTNTWGIHVNTVAPGSAGSLVDTLLQDMQTSIPPDVIAAPIDELLSLNRNSQTVVDLTPFVNSAKWGMDANTLQNFSPTFWNQDAVNGYRFGIPAQRSAKVMFYNSTWANELGFTTPPTTLADFKTQVCAAHASMKLDQDTSNDGLGGWLIDTDAMTIASWSLALGTSLESSGGIKFNTPAMQKTFTYLNTLLDQNCAWKGNDPSPYDYFANRKTLMYSADLQDLARQQSAQQLAGNNDDWMVIPFPTSGSPFILTQGASYAILTASSEKQLAAWLFIRWMSSADHIGSLVKASTTLPLSESDINYSIELEDSIPQWKEAVDLLPDAQIPPVNAYWGEAKMILEDASWQFFTLDLKGDQIPVLTQQMDQTLSDLIGKTH